MSSLDPRRPSFGAVSVLRFWLWGSGLAIALLVIWVVAPVLFLLLGLTAAIGIVCAVMIKLARLIETWRK